MYVCMYVVCMYIDACALCEGVRVRWRKSVGPAVDVCDCTVDGEAFCLCVYQCCEASGWQHSVVACQEFLTICSACWLHSCVTALCCRPASSGTATPLR